LIFCENTFSAAGKDGEEIRVCGVLGRVRGGVLGAYEHQECRLSGWCRKWSRREKRDRCRCFKVFVGGGKLEAEGSWRGVETEAVS